MEQNTPNKPEELAAMRERLRDFARRMLEADKLAGAICEQSNGIHERRNEVAPIRRPIRNTPWTPVDTRGRGTRGHRTSAAKK
jgi:hypothetical protein